MVSEYTRKYGEQSRQRCRDRVSVVTEYISSYKRARGCYFCLEVEPVCLEFHHLDPTKKDFEVASSRNRNFEVIKEEIEKCLVVCSNCHKKIHAGILKYAPVA